MIELKQVEVVSTSTKINSTKTLNAIHGIAIQN